LSRYGSDYYGAAYYGSKTLVDFSAAPFVAQPVNYSKIQLSWASPSGTWDYLRIVRNPIGFPIKADDGDVLFEDPKETARTTYLDQGAIPNNVRLKQGVPYYYSVFVRESTYKTWSKAGNAIGISVKDYNTNKTMYDYLPTILTSQVPYSNSIEQDNLTLKKFLGLFSLHLDLYKTQAENVHNRYNISDINGSLVPVFMKQLGLNYEPELGLKQSRIYLRNAIRLYQTKGSKLGVEEYVKAYAGYDNTVNMGRNLMLDYNDSSFEESIGSWVSISNAGLIRNTTVTPYAETLSQSSFPNKQKGVLAVNNTSGSSATVAFKCGITNPITQGIPVKAGLTYTLSAYTTAGTTGRAITSSIVWYNKNGTLISTKTSTSPTTNSNTAFATRLSLSGQAPAGSVYAVPGFSIASVGNLASNEKHYFDAIQFENSSSATYFQDARQIEITLKATRINELLNPNFETTTDNWTVTNGTFLLTTAESETPGGDYIEPISGGGLEVYSSSPGNVTVTSSTMAVYPGTDYTFSIYASSYLTGKTYPSNVFIKWYDNTSTLISTSSSTTANITLPFTRPYVTAVSPNNAVSAKVGFIWTSGTTGQEILLDAALFEKSSFVNEFFDGSHGSTSLTDLFWEGNVPNSGRSHYYQNRYAVQSRVVATLPKWLTHGSTFELLLAKPD
jgi:hypothetical protein